MRRRSISHVSSLARADPLDRDRCRSDDADLLAERSLARSRTLAAAGGIESARTRLRTGPSSCSPVPLTTPPPSTTSSGSKRFTIEVSPQASASTVSSQTALATGSPAFAACGDVGRDRARPSRASRARSAIDVPET